MTNDDMVFIVVNLDNMPGDLAIESVWTTKQLAKAAIHYHAQDTKLQVTSFRIIERKVNTAKLKK